MIHGHYDPLLVVLSYVIASAAGYTALDLTCRVRETISWQRAGWLTAAAVSMGGGIWAMHFVGMLAFMMPMPVSYDAGTTLVSLLLPIVVSGIGLSLSARSAVSWPFLALMGCITGSGIALMHYAGMEAMRMAADIVYDGFLVACSVAIAILASVVSLFFAFRITAIWQQTVAALVFGIAVVGMHYTGMYAATFVPATGVAAAGKVFDPYVLAISVASTTFFILLLCLASSITQHRTAQVEREHALKMADELERRVREQTANLQAALAQKDLFVRETHHRVKNNLNVINSLLSLSSRDLSDEMKERTEEINNRIRSIALVHERLYRSDSVRLDLKSYLCLLCEQLANIYGASDWTIEGDAIDVPADDAVPIGLIGNEVISNAYKHAFPSGPPKLIKISLTRHGEHGIVVIRDHGVGLAPDFEQRSRNSIGLRLIRGLTKQIGAESSLANHPEGGVEFRLRTRLS